MKVLIVGDENQPVDIDIIEHCTSHIEENRPIGAEVTVLSATGLEVSINAEVIIDGSTTMEVVQNRFEEALKNYLQDIAFDTYTVVYNRVAYILLDIPGVIDYHSLKINGVDTSVAVGSDQVPVLGTVVISQWH